MLASLRCLYLAQVKLDVWTREYKTDWESINFQMVLNHDFTIRKTRCWVALPSYTSFQCPFENLDAVVMTGSFIVPFKISNVDEKVKKCYITIKYIKKICCQCIHCQMLRKNQASFKIHCQLPFNSCSVLLEFNIWMTLCLVESL